MKTKRTLLSILALSLAMLINATDYYVDPVNGDDDFNDGKSEANAWKSLSTATTNKAFLFEAGDRLLLKCDGVFEKQQLAILEVMATPENPFTIASYGTGAKPRINAGGIATSGGTYYNGQKAAIYIYNSEGIIIKDIEVNHYTPGAGENEVSTTKQRYGIKIHGNGKEMGEMKYFLIDNVDVKHMRGNVEAGDDIAGAGIFYYGENGAYINGLEIKNGDFENIDRLAITGNNDAKRAEDWYAHLNIHVHHNYIHNIGGQGITIKASDGALIEYNRVDGVGQRDRGVGIWPYKADNTVIQHNIVSNCIGRSDGQGFDADWNCQNSIFQYNVSYYNEGGFILVCSDGNAAPWGDDKFTWNAGMKGTTVRYNLSVNDGYRKRPGTSKAYFSPAIHISGPVRQTNIYNNTIVMPKKEDDKVSRDFFSFGSWGGRSASGVNVFNNIFYVGDNETGTIDKWFKTGSTGGGLLHNAKDVNFSHNLYYGDFENIPTSEWMLWGENDNKTKADITYDENAVRMNHGGTTPEKLFKNDDAVEEFDITGLDYDAALAKVNDFQIASEAKNKVMVGKQNFVEVLNDSAKNCMLDYYTHTGNNETHTFTPEKYLQNTFGSPSGYIDFFGTAVNDSETMSIGFHSVGTTAGIGNGNKMAEFSVYPTFATTTVNVDKQMGEAYIINTAGLVVKKVNLDQAQNTIDVSNLTSGMYFITNGYTKGKFIKE